MKEVIFDIETDGLDATKIYCLSHNRNGKIETLTKPDEIREFVTQKDQYLIGHSIVGFDVPTLNKLLSCEITVPLVDTLALSWYLFPDRGEHGLEAWGEYFGIKKPEINDWSGLSLEAYKHRCEEDVRINECLWKEQKGKLIDLYKTSEDAFRLIQYLSFKMQCVQYAKQSGWKLDVELAKRNLEELNRLKNEKERILGSCLPKVPKRVSRTKPKTYFKQDGSLSAHGKRWEELCKSHRVNPHETAELSVVTKYEEPNPSSPDQIKNWLNSLGWDPCTYKEYKGKQVPQVKLPNSPDLAPSVLKLAEREPAILELEGLTIINHRISILKGFLDEVDKDGFLYAEVAGFTNTLRFRHKRPLVNLPGVDKPYGEYIRPCLIAEEGWELCGSDMSGLEDRTKQHYIWDHDPDYVKEMNQEDWDPHLDLAIKANLVSNDEAEFYKWYEKQH